MVFDTGGPELLLPFKIIRMFGPKMAIFAPKKLSQAHIGLASSFNALLVSWWLWRAGCISQDTYLLYVLHE